MRVSFIPGAGDSAPSNGYGVALLDADGVDVLQGAGAELSGDSATSICPLIGDGTTTARPVAIDGSLSLVISNAGNAKSGTVKLFYR